MNDIKPRLTVAIYEGQQSNGVDEDGTAYFTYRDPTFNEIQAVHPKCRTCRFSKVKTSLGKLERKYVGLCAYKKSTTEWFDVEFDVHYCSDYELDTTL